MSTGTIDATGLLTAFSAELAEMAASVRNSVVEVRAHQHGAGAGTIWRADGTIITNHHVVPGDRAEVRLADGRTFPASIAARDVDNDLVVLKIVAQGLPAVEIGDGRSLRPGELVFAIGHPFGVKGAVTAGVISTSPGFQDAESREQRELIRADVMLGPGNSGGPLIDSRGRVAGINAMVSGGMALAVPSHLVQRLLAGGGERRALGVAVREVELTPAAAAAAGLASTRVALVVGLAPGGPAKQAGVIVGDVLTGIDGRLLTGPDSLLLALASHEGAGARLSLLRGGSPHEIQVPLVAAESLQAA